MYLNGVQTLSSAQDPNIATLGPEALPREPEHIQDSTILDLTNPQVKPAPLPIPSDKMYRAMSNSVPNHEFPSFTQREFFVTRFDLKTTDILDHVVWKHYVPSDLFSIEGLVNITPFLNHVTNAIQMEYIFKVNPAPNQAGLYIFSVIPNCDVVSSNVMPN